MPRSQPWRCLLRGQTAAPTCQGTLRGRDGTPSAYLKGPEHAPVGVLEDQEHVPVAVLEDQVLVPVGVLERLFKIGT